MILSKYKTIFRLVLAILFNNYVIFFQSCSKTFSTNAIEKILDVENKEIVKKILCDALNTIKNVCTADLATCFSAEDIEMMNESMISTFLKSIAGGIVDEQDLDDCITYIFYT